MSQTPDFNLTTLVGFNTYAGKNNQIIGALRSSNSGPSFPINPQPFDFYINSNNSEFYIRNGKNTQWVKQGNVDQPEWGLLDALGEVYDFRLQALEDGQVAIQKSPNTISFDDSTSSQTGWVTSANPISNPQVESGWRNVQTTGITSPQGRYFTVRLPKEAGASLYRLHFTNSEGQLVLNQRVSSMTHRNDRTYTTYDFYQFQFPYDLALGEIRLQTISTEAHIHQNVWLGQVGQYGINQILTPNHLYGPLSETIEAELPISVNVHSASKTIQLGLEGFGQRYFLDRMFPTRDNSARGKFLIISEADRSTLELKTLDLDDISTGLPDTPTVAGNYELKIAADGTTTWIKAAVSPSEATVSGAIQVAAAESKTYSVAAGTGDLPQSTLFNITIEVGSDSKSIILRGSDLVGSQTTRIGNRTFQLDFTDGVGLRVRISAGTASSYEWVFSYGDISGGTLVKTDSSLTGNGSTATPLAVANPFTEVEEAQLRHLEELTNDDEIIQHQVLYEDAPAEEIQYIAVDPNSGLGTRLQALTRGGKALQSDIDILTANDSAFVSSGTLAVPLVVVFRIKPELTVSLFGLKVGDVEASSHKTHSYMQIGTDSRYSYFIVGTIQGVVATRKQISAFTTAYKGELVGPPAERIHRNQQALLDMTVVHDTTTRTTAAAADAGFTNAFGDSNSLRTKSIETLQAGLTPTEINELTDSNVVWLQDELLEDQTAAIVRVNHTRVNPANYLFWSRYTGLLRLDANSQIYRLDPWTYYRPHINFSGQAQATKIEVQSESSHTIYDGKLGPSAIESIGDVGGLPDGQLFYAFSSGTVEPVTVFRADYIDSIFGNLAASNTKRTDLRLMIRGNASDFTATNQFKRIEVAGQPFRTGALALDNGEFINGSVDVDGVLQKSGLFNLYIELSNTQWNTITDNPSNLLDVSLVYAVDGTDKTFRIRVPRLTQAQQLANPMKPWIPSGAVIGNGGGGSSRTRLGGRSWNLDNSQNARYQDTGITIPAMENDDFLRIAVAHPSFSSKHTESYSWEFIKDLAMTDTVGGTASFNNTFSMGDAVDSGTPSPRVIFTLTSSRRLLVAFFLSGGNPVGGAVKIAAWKE